MFGSVLANLARQEYSRDGVRGSLSLGERAGVRGNGTLAVHPVPDKWRPKEVSSFFSSLRRTKASAGARQAIVGQWVWSPLLKRAPDAVPDGLLLSAQA